MLTEDLLRAVAATPRIAPPMRHATAIVAANVDAEASVTVIEGVNRVGSAANRALALRREVPAARIALATEAITEAFDRDALVARAGASLPARDGEIALDHATRQLLDTGFVIRDDVLVREVAFAPGDRLADRYQVIELVGEGGMGAVYRALDEKLGREVALKLVRGRVADDALRAEVLLAQKVTHPNVCRTYDLEETEGNHVIKMEYVAGETLAARLRRGPVSVADTVRIVRAVADGLSAAHAQGVVHRDVKPENIMLVAERVVLMDFGVAHATGATGLFGGTLGYMPPEVIAGGEVDERADLFALGCVLAELLGDDLRRAPRWLRQAAALLRHREPVRRIDGLRRLRRGPRRWPLLAAPVALVLAAVTIRQLSAPHVWTPHVVDLPVFEENSGTISISPDSRWLAINSDRRTPGKDQIFILDRDTGAASQFTTRPDWQAARPVWSRDGRALLYTTQQIVCDGHPCDKLADGHILRQPVTGSPPRADGAPTDLGTGDAFDDCGDAIAIVEMGFGGWRLMLQQRDGVRRELVAAKAGEFILTPSCSPDGTRIAFVQGRAWETSGNDVFVVDRRGAVVQMTSDHVARAVTWTPDGRSLVVVRNDQLFELPSAGGEPRQLTTDVAHVNSPAVSRDGKLLAYIRDEGAFLPIVYGETGEPTFITRQRGVFWFMRPVNDAVAVAQSGHGSEWDVVALRLSDGAITNLGLGWRPFPSLDGKRVYFGASDSQTLFLAPLAGGARTVVAQLPAPLTFGNDAPDGQHVLVAPSPGSWAAYHVGLDGRVEPEQRVGLISVAPRGGWRAISVPKMNSDQFEVTLDVIAPGQPIDKPVRSIEVTSIYNEWLDDHRLGYCVPRECDILDVTTGDIVWRRPGVGDMMSAIAPDGRHVYDVFDTSHVTEHLITNFGDR